jgi:hypothetical protein
VCTLTTGQKESGKRYIIKTADRMIEIFTNSQGTSPPAISQSLHFDDEVYLATKDDKFEQKQERN